MNLSYSIWQKLQIRIQSKISHEENIHFYLVWLLKLQSIKPKKTHMDTACKWHFQCHKANSLKWIPMRERICKIQDLLSIRKTLDDRCLQLTAGPSDCILFLLFFFCIEKHSTFWKILGQNCWCIVVQKYTSQWQCKSGSK